MQRTTTTLARSLRALTLSIALGAAASTSLGGPQNRGGHGKHSGSQSYESCGQCDRRDHHSHAEGGVLWIGGTRFELSDRPRALERLERKLENYGYRVSKHGNELRISSRHRLGEIHFRSGAFRSSVLYRDRCTATIRFYRRGWNKPRHRGDRVYQNGGWDRGSRWSKPSRGWYGSGSRSSRIEICW